MAKLHDTVQGTCTQIVFMCLPLEAVSDGTGKITRTATMNPRLAIVSKALEHTTVT